MEPPGGLPGPRGRGGRRRAAGVPGRRCAGRLAPASGAPAPGSRPHRRAGGRSSAPAWPGSPAPTGFNRRASRRGVRGPRRPPGRPLLDGARLPSTARWASMAASSSTPATSTSCASSKSSASSLEDRRGPSQHQNLDRPLWLNGQLRDRSAVFAGFDDDLCQAQGRLPPGRRLPVQHGHRRGPRLRRDERAGLAERQRSRSAAARGWWTSARAGSSGSTART